METLAVFYGVFWLFLVAVAILWFCMPFLLMGTNRRLDKLIEQNKQLLERESSKP
jgi:hypothetical protein